MATLFARPYQLSDLFRDDRAAFDAAKGYMQEHADEGRAVVVYRMSSAEGGTGDAQVVAYAKAYIVNEVMLIVWVRQEIPHLTRNEGFELMDLVIGHTEEEALASLAGSVAVGRAAHPDDSTRIQFEKIAHDPFRMIVLESGEPIPERPRPEDRRLSPLADAAEAWGFAFVPPPEGSSDTPHFLRSDVSLNGTVAAPFFRASPLTPGGPGPSERPSPGEVVASVHEGIPYMEVTQNKLARGWIGGPLITITDLLDADEKRGTTQVACALVTLLADETRTADLPHPARPYVSPTRVTGTASLRTGEVVPVDVVLLLRYRRRELGRAVHVSPLMVTLDLDGGIGEADPGDATWGWSPDQLLRGLEARSDVPADDRPMGGGWTVVVDLKERARMLSDATPAARGLTPLEYASEALVLHARRYRAVPPNRAGTGDGEWRDGLSLPCTGPRWDRHEATWRTSDLDWTEVEDLETATVVGRTTASQIRARWDDALLPIASHPVDSERWCLVDLTATNRNRLALSLAKLLDADETPPSPAVRPTVVTYLHETSRFQTSTAPNPSTGGGDRARTRGYWLVKEADLPFVARSPLVFAETRCAHAWRAAQFFLNALPRSRPAIPPIKRTLGWKTLRLDPAPSEGSTISSIDPGSPTTLVVRPMVPSPSVAPLPPGEPRGITTRPLSTEGILRELLWQLAHSLSPPLLSSRPGDDDSDLSTESDASDRGRMLRVRERTVSSIFSALCLSAYVLLLRGRPSPPDGDAPLGGREEWRIYSQAFRRTPLGDVTTVDARRARWLRRSKEQTDLPLAASPTRTTGHTWWHSWRTTDPAGSQLDPTLADDEGGHAETLDRKFARSDRANGGVISLPASEERAMYSAFIEHAANSRRFWTAPLQRAIFSVVCNEAELIKILTELRTEARLSKAKVYLPDEDRHVPLTDIPELSALLSPGEPVGSPIGTIVDEARAMDRETTRRTLAGFKHHKLYSVSDKILVAG